jgi:RNAse (barnase) inhibitor barstar
MATVCLDGAALRDWPSFHRESQTMLGFPDFYGRNMDAWIDCLSTLRDDDGMCAFVLAPDETLQIEIVNSAVLQNRETGIVDILLDCVNAINERYAEAGEKPAVELLLR